MLKLGYSTGGRLVTADYPLKKRIKAIWAIGKEAIEINYLDLERLQEKLDDDDFRLIKQFRYVSLHAPTECLLNQKDPHLKRISDLSWRIKAQTIVFHPNSIKNFDWLSRLFKNKLAFENLGANKDFGKTINDLNLVFQKAPRAKLVLDLAHVYTLDPTMKLAKKFHQAFKERLSHYHISGYREHHRSLCLTNQDIILQGVQDLSIPIIVEGSPTRMGKVLLEKENHYLVSRLQKISI